MYFQPISILAFASATIAHMHLHYPPTLKGNNNPNTVGEADRYLNYPYGCCGQAVPGPCKGHLDLLDTDEGKPVVTWSAGQKVNFTLSGEKVTSNADEPVGGTYVILLLSNSTQQLLIFLQALWWILPSRILRR